jgi:hypothetical protein
MSTAGLKSSLHYQNQAVIPLQPSLQSYTTCTELPRDSNFVDSLPAIDASHTFGAGENHETRRSTPVLANVTHPFHACLLDRHISARYHTVHRQTRMDPATSYL